MTETNEFSWPRLLFDWVLEETNIVVAGLTACTILYTRSSAIIFFSTGAVVVSRIVKYAKRTIRQPRPLQRVNGKIKKSYGMPSTHSAVISYYAAYTILSCVYLPIHPSLPNHSLTRVIPPILMVPYAATIATSRIWLGHHTILQVAVGCTIGIVFAPFWFMLWTRVGHDYGNALELTYLRT
ncbi:PAP2-domain-containing protein [Panus rudis PR-1116 ss-1]|nr:PAP2-domain-containing protein [Panus rudis PR-1116 ss-1]